MKIRHWLRIVLLVLLVQSWLAPALPGAPTLFQHQAVLAESSDDVTPPHTSDHDPAPGQTAVPVDTSIVLNVADEGVGVDISTLVLKVNDNVVNPTITGTPASYTLSYKPPANFDFSRTISVTVEAEDLAGNVMPPYTYHFSTEATMPDVVGQEPEPGETGVSISTNISARVVDAGYGVDVASLSMRVNGTPVHISISGTPDDYTITYKPPVDFGHSEVVEVAIDATSLAGSVMDTVVYHFATMTAPDTAPPYITGWSPAPGQTNVPINTDIMLHVHDDGDGIDITTLAMNVEGVPVNFLITGTPSYYTLTYSPPVPFSFSQLVTVSVDASDLEGNGMPRVTYTFATEHDESPPYVSGKNPDSGATSVAVDAGIVLQIRDDGSGVNINSIYMTVQGLPVTPVITGTPAAYTLTYAPAEPFPYSETIAVSVGAVDLTGNVMPTISYTFMTQHDISPPYVTGQNPVPGATNVPVHTNIVLHVRDGGDGVDVSTISMKVNGTLVSPTIGGTPTDYQLSYNPPIDFGFGQVVTVRVEASDLAGNAMAPVSYEFTTQIDTTKPQAAAVSPLAGQTEVPINSSVAATITDSGSGVDIATIQMEIDGVRVNPIFTGSPSAYILTYTPSVPFQYSRVITVRIAASDLAGNAMAPFSYSFATEPDVHPPYVADAGPVPGATNVPVTMPLSINLLDSGEGVSINSIIMTVNGVPVTPDITGTPAKYLVTYSPAGGFSYSSIVNVTITASDLAGNQMLAYQYSFTTRPDTTPPYVSGLAPAPGAKGISIGPTIVLQVLDNGDGVDVDSIRMKVDGVLVKPGISSTPGGYNLSYKPSNDLGYLQKVDISIDAADTAGNTMQTYTYSFTTEPEPDTTPPTVSGLSPAPGEDQVELDRSIVMHITDSGDGVDIDTIIITMNGLAISPDVTGSPSNYKLSFPLPEDSASDQSFAITIAASDLAGNVMTPVSYSFTTKSDSTPPFVSNPAPDPGAIEVPLDTEIVVHIKDAYPGVDMDTIIMKVNGVEVTPTISGTRADYKLTYAPAGGFGYFDLVEVEIKASDLAGNAMTPYQYSFITDPGPVTVPDKPVNVHPEPEKTGVSLAPKLVASEFSHPNDAEHMASWWQIIKVSEEGEPETVFDSEVDGDNLTEFVLEEILLEPSTTYYWKVRYSDGDGWSEWSDETPFTTGGKSLPLWTWIVGGLGVFMLISVVTVLVLRRFEALPEWVRWPGSD